MTEGYLYCFSNQSMPGILKVGMTERTPKIRLNEANSSDTWRPPSPYKIEFAKKVLNPKDKETTLHKLLSQYTERINPKREFFRISPEEVKTFFDLIDGDLWGKDPEDEEDEEDEDDEDEDDEDEEDEDEDENKENKENKKNKEKGCRDMTKCFTHGQRIRHTIGINKTWIGIYDSSKNGIMYDTKFYKSLSGFAETHYSIDKTDRVKSANGWKECKCEVNGEWISTYNL
jgi:hypothetical protein